MMQKMALPLGAAAIFFLYFHLEHLHGVYSRIDNVKNVFLSAMKKSRNCLEPRFILCQNLLCV